MVAIMPEFALISPEVVKTPELSTLKFVAEIKLVKLVPEKLIPVPIVPERVRPLVKLPVPDWEILIALVVLPPLVVAIDRALVEVPEVAAWVISKASFVELLVKVKEVGTPSPAARLKAMFEPEVVVIELPPA